ncbi:MAG: hypothetical protein JST80_06680 [Bdellovibrionales bacterium]|nr:hypothetical protein [Bdellovibrionales bacterium]
MKSPLLFLALLVSTAAHADDYNLNFSEYSYRDKPAKRRVENPFILGLSMGNWAPEGITFSNRIQSPAKFENPMPYFSLSVTAPSIASGRLGSLVPKFGIMVSRQDRRDNLADGTQSSPQNLYLVPILAGIQFNPEVAHFGRLQAYVGLSVVPTIAMTDRSVFDDGETTLGWMGMGELGANFKVSSGLLLDVHGLLTRGSLKGNNLAAGGFGAGFGVLL